MFFIVKSKYCFSSKCDNFYSFSQIAVNIFVLLFVIPLKYSYTSNHC